MSMRYRLVALMQFFSSGNTALSGMASMASNDPRSPTMLMRNTLSFLTGAAALAAISLYAPHAEAGVLDVAGVGVAVLNLAWVGDDVEFHRELLLRSVRECGRYREVAG